MKNDKRIIGITMHVCIVILFLFFFSIICRFLTKQIFIDRFGWDNSFVDMLMGEERNMFKNPNKPDENGEIYCNINWSELYPFSIESEKEINDSTAIHLYNKYIDSISVSPQT